jgi:predicted membrane protein
MKREQRCIRFVLGSLIAVLAVLPVRAHDGSHASVHDIVAGILLRLQRELSGDQLVALTVLTVEAFLTAQEREVLGTAHIRFRVNVPVVVTILRDTNLVDEPFWLRERGFNATGAKVQLSNRELDT